MFSSNSCLFALFHSPVFTIRMHIDQPSKTAVADNVVIASFRSCQIPHRDYFAFLFLDCEPCW